jgi:hypothetical protein
MHGGRREQGHLRAMASNRTSQLYEFTVIKISKGDFLAQWLKEKKRGEGARAGASKSCGSYSFVGLMLSNARLPSSILARKASRPSFVHRIRPSAACRATPTSREVPLYPGSTQSLDIKIYYILEAAVLVGELGLIDAAYSGDWSRIGVISTEVELILQLVVKAVIVIHAIEGVIAAVIAKEKGMDPLVSWIKGFCFGALGIWEVYTCPSDDSWLK